MRETLDQNLSMLDFQVSIDALTDNSNIKSFDGWSFHTLTITIVIVAELFIYSSPILDTFSPEFHYSLH